MKHSVDRVVIVSIFIPKLRLILILNSFLGSSDSLVFSELFHFLAPRPFGARPTTTHNVKKLPACSELRWASCNHKATYFATYLTGGDCVPDNQNSGQRYRSEERFSRNAETDFVCRLLLAK